MVHVKLWLMWSSFLYIYNNWWSNNVFALLNKMFHFFVQEVKAWCYPPKACWVTHGVLHCRMEELNEMRNWDDPLIGWYWSPITFNPFHATWLSICTKLISDSIFTSSDDLGEISTMGSTMCTSYWMPSFIKCHLVTKCFIKYLLTFHEQIQRSDSIFASGFSFDLLTTFCCHSIWWTLHHSFSLPEFMFADGNSQGCSCSFHYIQTRTHTYKSNWELC